MRQLHFRKRGTPCPVNDVSTTMVYTRVLNKGGRGVKGPLESTG